ncbi:hypothetical protein [Cerasicoccus fimbriatus]|uniref:hypothetical protein n=1 Tax=Cerasicoccus fimbriatus TaxID=3014554 RepID=UPI0022B57B85|nr:hypothetical protein [Cerasicoccus sp. TK19100]
MNDKVRVLGAFELPVDEDLIQRQFKALYSHLSGKKEEQQARAFCEKQLRSTILFEVLIEEPDENFKVCDFTQPIPQAPRSSWQAAYMHTYLSPCGEFLYSRSFSTVPAPIDGVLRVTFFLHFASPEKELWSSYGKHKIPDFEPMPRRLSKICHYEPVD